MSFCSVIGSPVSLPVMIREAFCSRVLQPRRLPPPADWTQLAPGFRFHPTDEELVRYYLKRKVTSQPIRVDAIAVVDLYRFEPWDLPPLSRLRSRDMEWYFFTSLDRKYATRWCNNRATVDGYWKTTGKDRPVHHRSRIIGMKKTLVYHAGRAPRAQRTNWVMHEYRLEDEDLARQGIQMDGYVLCKVFQKSGPGPQNGAHYGAPFMEEEWEREGEEDNKLVPVNVERGDPLMEPTGHNYVQLDDFFQDTDLGIEPVDVVSLEASPEHEFHDHTENSAILIEEIFKDLDSVDNTLGAEFFAQHDSNIAWNGIVANNCLEDQLNFVSIQNNGYVQLSDIFDKEKAGSTCNLCPLHLLDGSAGGELCHSNNLPINNAVGSLVSNDLTIEPDQLRVVTSVNNGLCLHPDNLDAVLLEDLSYQVNEENLIYHDAFQNLEAVFTNESFSEFDHLDDFMAFHDATQENLDYVSPGSSQWQFDLFNSSEVQSNASAKVVGSSNQSSKKVHVQESLATHATLERAPNADGPSNGQCINFTDTSDVKSKHYQESPFTRRLASMLDSISAPPAFADESAVFVKGAKLFTSAPGSALHVTVPMLQIHDITQIGCAKSLGKHTEMGFFLSYGMGCSILSNSVVHEPRKKVHFGLLSVVLRGGFHLFFLCALLLAFSYKVGVLVYDL